MYEIEELLEFVEMAEAVAMSELHAIESEEVSRFAEP